MKETFTIREIMNNTGLTRQRVHQLIKSRDIPVVKANKHFLLKWQSLLKMADNPAILNFLKDTLQSEKEQVGHAYRRLRDNAKGMMYAYVLLIERELPTPEGTDFDWIRLFRKASYYWGGMPGGSGCHWALEADKYDYLDDEKADWK